jgi:hypothetical protein
MWSVGRREVSVMTHLILTARVGVDYGRPLREQAITPLRLFVVVRVAPTPGWRRRQAVLGLLRAALAVTVLVGTGAAASAGLRQADRGSSGAEVFI